MTNIDLDCGFIDQEKLKEVLIDLQDLLMKKYKLTPLERDIVLRIGQRTEAKIKARKEHENNIEESKAVAMDLFNQLSGGLRE